MTDSKNNSDNSIININNRNDIDNDDNDCEFIVDTLPGKEEEEDTFPTLLVAQKARRIVRKCMVEGVEGRESLGAEAVGGKRVIVVVLAKRVPGVGEGEGGERLLALNSTGGMLELEGLNGSSGLVDGLETS